MGLEFGEFTRLSLRSEDGWEPVDGISSIELVEESKPVEDASALVTESNVRKAGRWVPMCPAGIHPQHPDATCEEHELLARTFRDWLAHLVAEAMAEAERCARSYQEAMDHFLEDLRGCEPRGLIGTLTKQYEPTPIDRALQILAPHLAREPLYQPTVRMGRHVPDVVSSAAPTSEQPEPSLAPPGRPAWQSPYGPPPRRPR